jgi:hypothetical protein
MQGDRACRMSLATPYDGPFELSPQKRGRLEQENSLTQVGRSLACIATCKTITGTKVSIFDHIQLRKPHFSSELRHAAYDPGPWPGALEMQLTILLQGSNAAKYPIVLWFDDCPRLRACLREALSCCKGTLHGDSDELPAVSLDYYGSLPFCFRC